MRRLLPDAFVLVLVLTVCMASLWPVRGAVAGALSALATAAIVLLFFLHGARLPRENLSLALRHWQLHATILAITFVIFPLLGLALSIAFPRLLPADLWVGVLFLCALPSTVQSSIAFTSIAHGNVAGTVASAAASNLIGIALTPTIIAALTQAHATNISFSGIWNIVLVMLLPFVLGHLLRPWIGPWAAKSKRLLGFTDRGTIVLAVYSAFSAAVIEHLWRQVPLATFAVLVGVCVVLLISLLLIARFAARLLGFAREDEISIVFCGSKKSLVSGVPMARVLFAGPHVGAAILPLMIFHQIQLIVCAWIARRYAAGRMPDPASLPNENWTIQRKSTMPPVEEESSSSYPQAGRERMILPQPITYQGTGLLNDEKAMLQQLGPDRVFMMGDNAALPRMPAAPKLLDFFRLRFSEIAFRHLLQSAKSALDAGQDEKIVIACLLHDISNGALLRSDHGYWSAQLVAPYVSEEVAWAIQHHQALRYFADESVGFKYPDAYNRFFGSDYEPPPYIRHAYEEARVHRWYMTSRLVTIYDTYSFQDNWSVDPEQFTDVIGRHFKEPKQGLGFDGSASAHMWRTMIWPNNFL